MLQKSVKPNFLLRSSSCSHDQMSRNLLIQSLQLLASQMDTVDLSLLDETALKSIRLLQVGWSSSVCVLQTEQVRERFVVFAYHFNFLSLFSVSSDRIASRPCVRYRSDQIIYCWLVYCFLKVFFIWKLWYTQALKKALFCILFYWTVDCPVDKLSKCQMYKCFKLAFSTIVAG